MSYMSDMFTRVEQTAARLPTATDRQCAISGVVARRIARLFALMGNDDKAYLWYGVAIYVDPYERG